jgi:4-amino-4-deoxy-L-arabinose transferase-like glycosyltransferase
MPYLTLAYAAVFKLTDWSLLPARAVSALSAALAAGLVYALTAWFLREERRITRFLVSSAATLLLITNPIFRYTSGRAWNHDLPTLLTLIAVALFLRGDTGARPRAWILASGAMVGFAVGIRLTYLVALVPFLLTILLSRHPDRWRWRSVQIGSFSLGVVLASLPWLAFFAAAPRAFLFGNITYQTLNTDYRELLAHRVGETVLGKFVYFYHVLVDDPANLGLFLGFGIAATVAMITLWRRSWISRELVLLGGLSLILLAGAFVATPSWYQYFYAPVPFIILTGTSSLSLIRPPGIAWERAMSFGAAIVLLVCGVSVVAQNDWSSLRDARTWVPVQTHDLGVDVRKVVGEGKVLTLAPTIPLEGGLGMYTSLATGPFSWRVAPLLTREQRAEFGLLSYDDLESSLGADPPAAILTGFEAGNEGFEPGSKGGLEDPLDDYAHDHGYSLMVMKTPLIEHEVRLWFR